MRPPRLAARSNLEVHLGGTALSEWSINPAETPEVATSTRLTRLEGVKESLGKSARFEPLACAPADEAA